MVTVISFRSLAAAGECGSGCLVALERCSWPQNLWRAWLSEAFASFLLSRLFKALACDAPTEIGPLDQRKNEQMGPA